MIAEMYPHELIPAELGRHGIYCGCFDAAVRGRDKCARDCYHALWRNGTGSADTNNVLSGASRAIGVREGIDVGAVGGFRLVRIAVGRSVMMEGNPLLG